RDVRRGGGRGPVGASRGAARAVRPAGVPRWGRVRGGRARRAPAGLGRPCSKRTEAPPPEVVPNVRGTAGVALSREGAPQDGGILDPGVPLRPQIRLIGAQLAGTLPRAVLGEGLGTQVASDGAPCQPDDAGDLTLRHPALRMSPHRFIPCQAPPASRLLFPLRAACPWQATRAGLPDVLSKRWCSARRR